MGRWVKISFLAIVSLGLLLLSSNAYASNWWDAWESDLTANYGNWSSIAKWVKGVQLTDNSGNLIATISVNPQNNTAAYTRIIGGVAVGGHQYEQGAGWRYNVVEYVRDGVKLIGIYSSIDSDHTQLTIYLGNGISVNVSIDEGGLTANDIVAIMDAIAAGNYAKDDNDVDNDDNTEEFYITTGPKANTTFTFSSISFSAGWVREHLDTLESSVESILAEYGIDMAELDQEYDKDLDNDGDKDIFDALIDTFSNYKAPLANETTTLVLGIEFNEVSYAINDADLAAFLENIYFTGNWTVLRDNYIDYAKNLTKSDYESGKGFDWNGDGKIDGADYDWLHDASRTDTEIQSRMKEIFDDLVFKPLYLALMTGEYDGQTFGIGSGVIEIDIDNDGDTDIEIKLVDEGSNVGIRLRAADLKNGSGYVTTQWMDGNWIKWRHIPDSLWNDIVNAQNDYKNYKNTYEGFRVTNVSIVGVDFQVKDFSQYKFTDTLAWDSLWGDPACAGNLQYNEATGEVTMTVDIWRDANGKLHVSQAYWDNLSEEERQALIESEGGIENIEFYEETLTVTLDLSQLDEDTRNAIIEAAKNGENLILYGLGPDELEPGDTIVVLGLGFGEFEEFPY